MCHWVRDPDRRRAGVTQDSLPSDSTRLGFVRPRILGAVAAALVALVATAALLMPSSTPAVSSDKAAAVAAVATPRAAEPVGVVIEQTSTNLDDGVPSAAADVPLHSARGHCEHDL